MTRDQAERKARTVEIRCFTNGQDGEREAACKAICESGNVKRGREGHEYWRALGEVRHVYAFLMKDGSRIRLVSGARSPALYGNREQLERTVRA